MNRLVALQGPANVGKSEALRMLRDILLDRYPNAQQEHRSRKSKVDFRIVLTIDGCKIGIESQGDPGSRLPQSLALFVREQCNVIVCAVRTRGSTFEAVERLGESYEIEWLSKNGPSEDFANEIASKIEEVIRAMDKSDRSRANQEAEFVSLVAEWLEFFDAQFEEMRLPIPERPFLAASWFVEHAIAKVEGASKDDYLSSEWFRDIMKPVQLWYRDKYGEALRSRDGKLVGVIDALGAFFRIEVPRSLIRPEDDDTYWVVFPLDVQPEEDPKTWLHKSPRLESLDEKVRESIIKKVISTGTRLRKIHMDLTSAIHPDDQTREFSRAVITHLISAARIIEDHRELPVGVACWEAHQAVEKTLKMLARQNGVQFPKTHDLTMLFRLVEKYLPGINASPSATLPNKDRVIEMRMGEGAAVPVSEAFQIYEAALDFITDIGPAMPRRLTFKNSGFLLRKLPWQKPKK